MVFGSALAATTAVACHSRARAVDPLIVLRPAAPVAHSDTLSTPASVVVVVRSSSSPEQTVGYATVVLQRDGHGPIGVRTGADGVARLDTVPVAAYVIRAYRLGYDQYTVPMAARAGCAQHVEIYLKPHMTCLFTCPQVPARATITTCAPGP